jgi:hypothetical protein
MEPNVFFKIKVFIDQDYSNPMVEVTRPVSRILGLLIVPLVT